MEKKECVGFVVLCLACFEEKAFEGGAMSFLLGAIFYLLDMMVSVSCLSCLVRVWEDEELECIKENEESKEWIIKNTWGIKN